MTFFAATGEHRFLKASPVVPPSGLEPFLLFSVSLRPVTQMKDFLLLKLGEFFKELSPLFILKVDKWQNKLLTRLCLRSLTLFHSARWKVDGASDLDRAEEPTPRPVCVRVGCDSFSFNETLVPGNQGL